MLGMYSNTTDDGCFPEGGGEPSDFCKATTRNNPLEDWEPTFVVFALTADHVQAAVSFAVAHSLCIAVAGTGHDFLNRHSCYNGMLIRTTLLKGFEWALDDKRGPAGTVKVGSGVTFSEISKSAAENKRMVAQGWGITVGIAGWTMGGGHGPFAGSFGLGVDNLVEAEVVTADGNLLTANATTNTDVWRALRGGGGSAFGVVTSMTLRAHPVPEGGITTFRTGWGGNGCQSGIALLQKVLHHVFDFMLNVDTRWSGLVFITPTNSTDASTCYKTWTLWSQYSFLGPSSLGTSTWTAFTKVAGEKPATPEVLSFQDQWDRASQYPLEQIAE